MCLVQVLRDPPLEFWLLQSSLSSTLGGLGLAPYAAANLFMDSFTYWHNQTSSIPWLTINWDGWTFDQAMKKSSGLAKLALSSDEGITAFEYIFTLRAVTQIVV